MAIVQVKFLKPFLWNGGATGQTGPVYLVKVDNNIEQMRGYVPEELAVELISHGLAATGPTAY